VLEIISHLLKNRGEFIFTNRIRRLKIILRIEDWGAFLMLIEYIEGPLAGARYEIIDDEEPYYGEIPQLKGIWATGKTLEECRKKLSEVIEGWIMVENIVSGNLRKLASVAKLSPISWTHLVRKLLVLTIPNPHKKEISADLLMRVLRQANIEKEEWIELE
jgi:predicted RNase H-like HicB family nuclease